MACYLPIPPRAWSRVQNSCSLTTNIENNGLVKLPYSNNFVPASTLGQRIAMLNKGNVLQYKANSSNLTQAQKYSKIAQGKWTNRNTTWATQSTRGYTNPNNTSLKRSGNVTNVAIDPITGAIIGTTTAPVTCPKPITPINEALPSNGGGGTPEEPEIPPPVPPSPESETFPPIIPNTPPEPIVIQDEGILICSVQENICTGETKSTISQQLCNPTSDSDVPGTIQLLCWNDGTPTWYPRSRYIMTNSANKWPTNATLFSAVRPPIPNLSASVENCTVNLNWITNTVIGCSCLPVTAYNIYINGQLYQTVPGNINSLTLFQPTGIYEIYITSLSDTIESFPSNIINVLIEANYIIITKFNIKLTRYTDGITELAKIETTVQPGGNVSNGYGQATLVLCNSVFISGIIVGGGGGGASGTNKASAPGQGGGGGAINVMSSIIFPLNTNITLQVGSGGRGNTNANANSSLAGSAGVSSFISYSGQLITSQSGREGSGAGDASSDGPDGGSATSSLLSVSGYGGGGGGGAGIGILSYGGLGGTGSSNNGINGQNSTSTTSNTIGGNGGDSGLSYYSVPVIGDVYFGGGGGGGEGSIQGFEGGTAGNGTGGIGGGNSNNNPNGTTAINYGGGGGGGSQNPTSNNNNTGGNGANGVIFLWH